MISAQRRVFFVAEVLLLTSVAVSSQVVVESCIRALAHHLGDECHGIHSARGSNVVPHRNLSSIDVLQWVANCFDSSDWNVTVLAPNLSVTAYLKQQMPLLTSAFSASGGRSYPVDTSIVPLSAWGRTLSHLSGVNPVGLGLAADAPKPSPYDAYMVDPVALADMYDARLLLDLSPIVLDAAYKEQIEWVGIHHLFRSSVVVDDGIITSLPFGGLVYQMYYRRDILSAAGLSPPATWDEFLAVAAAVNGTDMNGDGVPDYGVCLQRPRYCFNGFNLAAIWSSFIQSKGTKQGAFFDPVTMQPLVNNAAMRAAMDIYVALRAYGPPDESNATCLPYNIQFVRGRCALTLSWGYQLKANTFLPFSVVRDKTAVAILPGSSQVLDRTTGMLRTCVNTDVCPFAKEAVLSVPNGNTAAEFMVPAASMAMRASTSFASAGAGGDVSRQSPLSQEQAQQVQLRAEVLQRARYIQAQRVLVNRAPYLALATVSAGVSAHSPVAVQSFLLRLIAHLSSRNVSWEAVTSPLTELGPFRYEHFDPANLNQWVRRGYPPAVMTEFLAVMKSQVDSENVMLEVRTLDAYVYRRMLDTYATAVSEGAVDVSSALLRLEANLTAVFGPHNPRFKAMRRTYLYSIGALDQLNAPPTPPAAPTDAARNGAMTTLAVLLPSVIVVVLASGMGWLWCHCYWRRRLTEVARGPRGHPGLGQDTTLVVSDIEGSTALWEALDAGVMDVVFNLHHDCMRRAAVRHAGYESQTEGDSFIIAFHRPDDAALFALEVQAALLEEPWPQELLAHPGCQPVWLAPTGADVGLELPLHLGGSGSHGPAAMPLCTAARLGAATNECGAAASGGVSGAATGGQENASNRCDSPGSCGGSTPTRLLSAHKEGGSLRRALANSWRRVNMAGIATGTQDIINADSPVPHDNALDGAVSPAACRSINGERLHSASAVPGLASAPRIECVADALRVMWREVSATAAAGAEQPAVRRHQGMRALLLSSVSVRRGRAFQSAPGSPRSPRLPFGRAAGASHAIGSDGTTDDEAGASPCATISAERTVAGLMAPAVMLMTDSAVTGQPAPQRAPAAYLPRAQTAPRRLIQERRPAASPLQLPPLAATELEGLSRQPDSPAAQCNADGGALPKTPSYKHHHHHPHGGQAGVLVHRGLRVRLGMHTGVRLATDLVYSDVAARWKYSGEVLAAAKAVSDAANGGDVLMGTSTLQRLSSDLLAKRVCPLYLGRYTLRGGAGAGAGMAPGAGGGGAAMSLLPAPPEPGGLADLYALYSPRLLPRLGTYRPPRAAQTLGLGTLDAPLGAVTYGVMHCPGAADLAAQDGSAGAEAAGTLASINGDQLLACHGVPAAGAAASAQGASCATVSPAGFDSTGAAAAAFRNPYHAILWALQVQDDLKYHSWSQELLAHEQFEEIVVQSAVADALLQRNSGHSRHGRTSWPAAEVEGSHAAGHGNNRFARGVRAAARAVSKRASWTGAANSGGPAGAGSGPVPSASVPLPNLPAACLSGDASVKPPVSATLCARDSGGEGHNSCGPGSTAEWQASALLSGGQALSGGGPWAMAASSSLIAKTEELGFVTEPASERNSAAAAGSADTVRAAASCIGALHSATGPWASALLPIAASPTPHSAPSTSEFRPTQSMSDLAKEPQPAALSVRHAGGFGAGEGDGGGNSGSVVLFRGPRVKGAITYGHLKAVLDPSTGRLRYEGKAVAAAAKMLTCAAVGMVVASVEAVEHGTAEQPKKQEFGGPSPKSPCSTNPGVAPAAVMHAGEMLSRSQRASLGRIAQPSPLVRQDSTTDPEGPSAAVAAAAAAAAAALLNLDPADAVNAGGSDSGSSELTPLPVNSARHGRLAQLAAAMRAGKGGATSGSPGTSHASSGCSTPRSGPSCSLGVYSSALRPESRATSRNARAMSHLNPDSRQTSRTALPPVQPLTLGDRSGQHMADALADTGSGLGSAAFLAPSRVPGAWPLQQPRRSLQIAQIPASTSQLQVAPEFSPQEAVLSTVNPVTLRRGSHVRSCGDDSHGTSSPTRSPSRIPPWPTRRPSSPPFFRQSSPVLGVDMAGTFAADGDNGGGVLGRPPLIRGSRRSSLALTFEGSETSFSGAHPAALATLALYNGPPSPARLSPGGTRHLLGLPADNSDPSRRLLHVPPPGQQSAGPALLQAPSPVGPKPPMSERRASTCLGLPPRPSGGDGAPAATSGSVAGAAEDPQHELLSKQQASSLRALRTLMSTGSSRVPCPAAPPSVVVLSHTTAGSAAAAYAEGPGDVGAGLGRRSSRARMAHSTAPSPEKSAIFSRNLSSRDGSPGRPPLPLAPSLPRSIHASLRCRVGADGLSADIPNCGAVARPPSVAGLSAGAPSLAEQGLTPPSQQPQLYPGTVPTPAGPCQGHSNPLQTVGLDEVTMTPVALKKRSNSQPLVVYLCRFSSSERAAEMAQRLVAMGRGNAAAALAAAAAAAPAIAPVQAAAVAVSASTPLTTIALSGYEVEEEAASARRNARRASVTDRLPPLPKYPVPTPPVLTLEQSQVSGIVAVGQLQPDGLRRLNAPGTGPDAGGRGALSRARITSMEFVRRVGQRASVDIASKRRAISVRGGAGAGYQVLPSLGEARTMSVQRVQRSSCAGGPIPDVATAPVYSAASEVTSSGPSGGAAAIGGVSTNLLLSTKYSTTTPLEQGQMSPAASEAAATLWVASAHSVRAMTLGRARFSVADATGAVQFPSQAVPGTSLVLLGHAPTSGQVLLQAGGLQQGTKSIADVRAVAVKCISSASRDLEAP